MRMASPAPLAPNVSPGVKRFSTRCGSPKRTITACCVSGTIEKVLPTRMRARIARKAIAIGLRAKRVIAAVLAPAAAAAARFA